MYSKKITNSMKFLVEKKYTCGNIVKNSRSNF